METINHVDRGHSQLGASSSDRWFACPASVPLSQDQPNTSSIHAERGTAAHELAEHCLLSDMDAKDCIGIEKNGHMVTEEMAEAVQVYLDTIRADFSEEKEMFVEDTFELDWIDEELFGTNDCSIVEPFKKLTVYDYKNGAGKTVEAVENTQLMYYALGARRGYDVNEVELVIVQPNTREGEPVKRWVTTTARLDKFEKELKAKVADVNKARALRGDDVYTMAQSGDHCTFCPAKGFCKKMKEQAFEIANSNFDEVVDNRTYLPDPSELTPKQLRRVLEGAKLIANWVKGVEEYAFIQAEKGEKIDGYKLVQKRANRQWKDEKEVQKHFEVFADDLFTKKLKSPAQLEKLLGKSEVAKFTETPEAGLTLVQEKDKRKAVEIKPVDLNIEFDDLFN